MAARVTRAKKKIAGRAHPLPGAGRRRAAGPAGRRAHRRCTWCSRPGTRRRRATTWCAPTWSQRALDLGRVLARADAGRAGGPRPARPDAAHRRAPRDTRVDAAGRLVLLADQDRDRWDRAQVLEGLGPGPATCTTAGSAGSACRRPSPREHAVAPSYDETRWPRVRRALRRAAARVAVAGRGAQPGGRAGRGRRPGGGARRGGPAGRRRPAGGLPLPARDPGRPAAPAGPQRGGGDGVPTRRWPWPTTTAERAFLTGRRDDARRP